MSRAARAYLDFTLELRDLDRQGDTFKVAVLPSRAAGETRESASVAYRYEELADDLVALERKVIAMGELIGLGERLAARLLPPGEVRELFRQAVWRAGQDGGVRLRLLIREPALAQLPWEFSYLQLHAGERDRRHFLALNPQISLVRHEALPEPHAPVAGAAPARLRLVAALADAAGYPRLDLDREQRVIAEALRDLSVDGVAIECERFLRDVTFATLLATLQQGADFFHFAGHGGFAEHDADSPAGPPVGAGVLVLAGGEGGAPRLLGAGELALLLQRAGVRVAVLGACESGRRDGVSAWTGIAPALVERGVPAVVAMQYAVIDAQAVAFSQAFYTALAGGLTVDEAVATGRLAMLGTAGPDDAEWGVPVLYMRAPDGVVFPNLAGRDSGTADALRRAVRQTVETIEAGGEVLGLEIERARSSSLGSFEVTQKATTVKGRLVGAKIDELG